MKSDIAKDKTWALDSLIANIWTTDTLCLLTEQTAGRDEDAVS